MDIVKKQVDLKCISGAANNITIWSRVLLEKLIVTHIVKNFLPFM
jgi:hypothetical protein